MYLYVAHAVCAAVGYHPINDSVLTVYIVRISYMHASAIVFYYVQVAMTIFNSSLSMMLIEWEGSRR